MQGTFKLIPADEQGVTPGQLHEIVGKGTFSGTNATLELNVGPLTTIKGVSLTPIGTSHDPQDFIFVDNTITSGAITLTRAAAGTSGLTFWYRILGLV